MGTAAPDRRRRVPTSRLLRCAAPTRRRRARRPAAPRSTASTGSAARARAGWRMRSRRWRAQAPASRTAMYPLRPTRPAERFSSRATAVCYQRERGGSRAHGVDQPQRHRSTEKSVLNRLLQWRGAGGALGIPRGVAQRQGRISSGAPFCVSVNLWLILSVFSVPSVSAQPRLTFTKDIAPIIWNRCATCHRPGEIGPFSLLTYDEVARRATQIATVTRRGLMPPWKPTNVRGTLQDDR